MTRTLILILLLYWSAHAVAQQSEIDSLFRVLPTTKQDTTRIKVLIALSWAHTNLDSAIFYAQEGLRLAEKINYHKGQAECLLEIASIYYATGDEIKSLEFYQKSLELFKQVGDEEGIISALEGNAILYFLQNDFRQELRYHQQAEKIARKLNATTRLVPILGNIGKTYLELGQLDSARISLLEAQAIIKNNTIPGYFTAYVLSQLGDLMSAEGKDDQAIVYLHQSLSLFKEDNNDHRTAEAYVALSNFYFKSSQLDSVSFYAEKALELGRTTTDSLEFIEEAAKNLSQVYEQKNNHKEALRYHKVAAAAKEGLLNFEKINKLSGLSFLEKQRAQELITAKKEYQNKRLLYSTAAGLFICLLIVSILYYNNGQKQKAKLKIEKAFIELKATQALLVQREKMASLGELTAGVAHEIQNPLNFVNNFSDVNTELIEEIKTEMQAGNIKEVFALLNNIAENEQKINQHGKRADAIIKGMLQHSRSSSGVKEPTDINALADEYLRLAYHGLRAKDKSFNATMKTDFDETIGNINVIPQDIGRVILNLITNAFYAATEKKKQSGDNLPTEQVGYEPTVWISTKKLDGKVLVSVRDNGNGIPQKVLDKIFQPFFTTKPTGQGTGLGLSLSYDIVHAHGGELTVETKEGHGTSLVMIIPTR